MDIDIQPAVEDSDPVPGPTQTFIPGRHVLSKDEILEPDQSAYEMLHRMNVAWPCLSFDILRDNLGDERRKYPATVFSVTGTQADSAKKNEILVLKMSSLHKTQNDDGEAHGFSYLRFAIYYSSEDSDGDDEEDEGALDENAVLEHKSIPYIGGINRIRAQPMPGNAPSTQSYHVASWSETGKVHIHNIRPYLQAFDMPDAPFDSSKYKNPVHTVSAHGTFEGFALDWAASTNAAGSISGLRLLSGDIASKIYLTTSTTSGFNTSTTPFTSHTSSIEDLQWSPSEGTVFASCSADRSIRIWDVRVKGRKSAMAVEGAHENDVNVISWNKLASASYLLVSGGDEGGIKVWDLRGWNKSVTLAEYPIPNSDFLSK
jgi:ribosome assembly protein RRB1